MKPYDRHIFVCLNERPPENPVGCCSRRGAEEVFAALKAQVKSEGLSKSIRVNRSGCLGQCHMGVTAVVYPEGVWYQKLKLEDVPEIVEQHLKGGTPVQRLMPPSPSSDCNASAASTASTPS